MRLVIITAIALCFLDDLSGNDKFIAVELPSELKIEGKYCLNSQGQVVGSVLIGEKNKYISFQGKMAAYWEREKGLEILDNLKGASIATAINDLGVISVRYLRNPLNQLSETLLWDTKNGEIIYGPQGRPESINNFNQVVIISDSPYESPVIWDSLENTMEKEFKDGLSENKGVISLVGGQWTFNKNGKSYPIILSREVAAGNEHNFFINSNDEVFCLVYLNNDRSDVCIAKWKNGNNPMFSPGFSALPQLISCKVFQLIAVNDVGDFLINSGGIKFLLNVDDWNN